MLVLSIDCSTHLGSTAILNGDQILAHQSWTNEMLPREKVETNKILEPTAILVGEPLSQHSEKLLPAIRRCLQYANCRLNEINLISVGHGPGRFTGVRVAVNVARALAYSLNIRVVGYSSLEVVAAAVPLTLQTDLVVIFNAHKNCLYMQEFTPLGNRYRPTSGPSALFVKDFESIIKKEVICAGDAYSAYSKVFSEELRSLLIRNNAISDLPSAITLGRIGHLDFDPVTTLDWDCLTPLYIRTSEAEERLKAGSLPQVSSHNWKD